MVNPYGFKNENNPVKDTYELAIPQAVVPIENPTGRQHRLAASTGWLGLFFKNAPRAHYMQDHTGPFCMAFLRWSLLGRRRLSGLTALTDITRGVLA